ncbi:MAG: AsmA-like C-terminal region-containing protein [Bacteroidota bacterium]
MKKALKIVGVILIVVLALMIVIPILFKGEIEELVKEEANKNLNATVDFQDVGLNLFSNFPNFSLNINDLSVVNQKPFEGDTLLSAGSISTTIDLMSVVFGDEIKIKSVSLNSPRIMVLVLKDGTANYNIMKESTQESTEEAREAKDTTASSFNVAMENYSITNGMLALIDKNQDMVVVVNNLNHKGAGEFSSDDFLLETRTTIDELTYKSGGVSYLNRVNTELDMNLQVNVPNLKLTLKDNQLRLNNLLLNFDGSIAMPGEDIDINLNFAAARTEFKDIISLIPAIYSKDFEDIKSSGKMELKGNVKGILNPNNIPSFNLNLNVMEGKFQYPDLPMPVSNVNMKLAVKNPGGVADNTIIDLQNLHVELGEDPFDMKLLLKNPISKTYIEANMRGVVDLNNIKSAFALNDISKLEGTIQADMEAKGILPSEEDNNYEDIDAKGEMKFKDIVYQSNDLPDEVNISSASLTLTPKYFKLNNMEMKIGESDLKAAGSLRNLIPYTLSDGILLGNLKISSKYLNVNPFLTEGEAEEGKTVDKKEQQVSAVEIPGNLDLTMTASFNRLIYDNLDIKNAKGQILIKDKKLTMKGLRMNLLGGSMVANGTYIKRSEKSVPEISFKLSVNNFNIRKTYDSFVSVSMFAPIAKYVNGNFGAKMELTSTLDENLRPVWNNFNSTGILNLKRAEIKNYKPFTTLGSMLNISELSNPKLQNVKPKYRITNGRFYLSPIKYKVGEYDITLVGSNGIDQSLDYVMEVDVPAGKFKNQANKAISSLLGKDVNVVTADKIKVNAKIGGTIDKPKVSTSAEDVVSDVASSAIKQAEEEAKKQAEAYADSLKKEAERKLQEEIKKQEEEAKKKLEEEAKNLLQNLFKKKP